MEDCKPVGMPLDPKVALVKATDEEWEQYSREMQGIPYKACVGSLMYAMVATRADLAFAVGTVRQFMSKPGPAQWPAVKR